MLRLTEIVARAGAGATPAGVEAGLGGAGAGAGAESKPPAATLTLTFEDRRRSRLLVRLDDGREAALMLPRGSAVGDGAWLRDETGGVVVAVRAAPETLSVVRTADPHLLTRAAYHLGNRHVPLEIGVDHLAYQHDHVLDGLVRDLGLDVTTEVAPFEPEGGGYRHGRDGAAASAGGENDESQLDGRGHRHADDHPHPHDSHGHTHPHPDDSHGHTHTHGEAHGHTHGR